jgi:hypothetical protein
MAELRLMVLLAATLGASCGRSEAAPTTAPASGLVTPAGWTADVELAKVAASAMVDPKSGDLTVTASEAWSARARGCYAVWLDLHGAAAPIEAAATQLLDALAHELPGIAIHEVVKPAPGDHGTLALAFDTRGYHGTLRVELAATGDVRALACLWNSREPAACAVGCATLSGGAK